MKKILLLSFTFLLGFTALAQEKFTEGIIISKQSMAVDTDDLQVKMQMASMTDVETITYIKGSKSHSKMDNETTGSVVTISDMDAQKVLVLMDNPQMGKIYMLQDVKITEEMIKNVEVTEGEETKEILGYKCEQYIVETVQNGAKTRIEMFVTDKIEAAQPQQTALYGEKIKGFPLYMKMSMEMNGEKMDIITEVTEIKQESVSDDMFSLTPPEGYKSMY